MKNQNKRKTERPKLNHAIYVGSSIGEDPKNSARQQAKIITWLFQHAHLPTLMILDTYWECDAYETKNRATLNRLLDHAREGLVDVVVVTSHDRLFRNVALLRWCLDEFRKLGVQVLNTDDHEAEATNPG